MGQSAHRENGGYIDETILGSSNRFCHMLHIKQNIFWLDLGNIERNTRSRFADFVPDDGQRHEICCFFSHLLFLFYPVRQPVPGKHAGERYGRVQGFSCRRGDRG